MIYKQFYQAMVKDIASQGEGLSRSEERIFQNNISQLYNTINGSKLSEKELPKYVAIFNTGMNVGAMCTAILHGEMAGRQIENSLDSLLPRPSPDRIGKILFP